ncbi:AraC family transcriptional regulator [Stenotrophomonas sp. Y6]|uniref:helix-turn-helix transcriptional regulator n=1 Tax=Stenotrophomonas sp. Y6 TaxID=2920383 RepID=UPI001F0620B8|nr:AraC family transcriptional regulator [Stenotrophomonas sp. Y6]MCH1909671.1 AraC family transcriptional regulator [Stenotrophomonas sp. Y6]
MQVQMQVLWLDRGDTRELEQVGDADLPLLATLARGASLALGAAEASFWLVLRGELDIAARAGAFRLGVGQWIHFDRGAHPLLHAGERTVAVGLVLPAALQMRLLRSPQLALFPGRGSVTGLARRLLARRWRAVLGRPGRGMQATPADRWQVERLLRALAGLQQGQQALIARCPGRSLSHRRQVYARMQRALQYIEGHTHRVVRIGELAELSSMSVWYFTKTFRAVYGECPQATSVRLRLASSARLIRDTSLSITEVGAASGFENNCSFSRAFRTRFGVTPSLYRSGAQALSTDPANPMDRACGAVA